MSDSVMMGDANYPEQARTYDLTRSASPTVSRRLARFLGEGRGRTLLDVAGGTGNYAKETASHGFRPFVVDREPAMLVRSIDKIGSGRQVLGDALRLPFADRSVDVVMIVSAIHQFPDQGAALAEARRVIRDGPFVLQAFTKESLVPAFAFEYFPGSGPPPGMHPSNEEMAALLRAVGFSRVEWETFVYEDMADGTLHALHIDPYALADVTKLRNTSIYQRLDQPARRTGVEALQRDLESGRLAERVEESLRLAAEHGHGSVFAAWP